jgi:hypothetical protein
MRKEAPQLVPSGGEQWDVLNIDDVSWCFWGWFSIRMVLLL